MGAKRLLTARQLARDLEKQAALGLELPRGRGAILSYRAAPRGGHDRVLGPLARAARLLQPPGRVHERRRARRLQAAALMSEVGRVAALWRYPVKSMAAERWRRSTCPGTGSPATAAGPSSGPGSSAATSPG